jgi:hypothetical protein
MAETVARSKNNHRRQNHHIIYRRFSMNAEIGFVTWPCLVLKLLDRTHFLQNSVFYEDLVQELLFLIYLWQ